MPSRASSDTNSSADCLVRSSACRSKASSIGAVVSAFDAARPCGEPFAISAVSSATVAVDVVGRDGDQADLRGLVGAELLAGDEIPARGARGHLRQQRQRDDRRRHPDPRLGQREGAVAARDDDVAGTDEPEPAGPDMAVDRADDRLRHFEDRAQHRRQLARVVGDRSRPRRRRWPPTDRRPRRTCHRCGPAPPPAPRSRRTASHSAWRSWSTSAVDSALRLCGESRVSRATGPSTE